mmetsp:Transcript_22338/g.34588  ORF Transcript_22338/g.34588 Transcript_22338/m.34588 type:complete len:156 (+) Transcript_22338:309-776(+)
MSILMGDLTSGLMGLILSTAIITTFGEIIPQAMCSRYALVVGAYTTWYIYIFMVLTFPVSFPLSAILDKVLGEEVANTLTKGQMKNMFDIYEQGGFIERSEKLIIQAALELQEKGCNKVMTPVDEVFMLDVNTKLTHEVLRDIYSRGFSRIPIYN